MTENRPPIQTGHPPKDPVDSSQKSNAARSPERPRLPANWHYADQSKTYPADGMPFILQMLIGFFAFIVTGGIFLRAPLGIILAPVVAILMNIAALKVLHWRGFLIGYLTGIGLILLAFGFCVALLTQLKF
jgi:hypothetical protein